MAQGGTAYCTRRVATRFPGAEGLRLWRQRLWRQADRYTWTSLGIVHLSDDVPLCFGCLRSAPDMLPKSTAVLSNDSLAAMALLSVRVFVKPPFAASISCTVTYLVPRCRLPRLGGLR